MSTEKNPNKRARKMNRKLDASIALHAELKPTRGMTKAEYRVAYSELETNYLAVLRANKDLEKQHASIVASSATIEKRVTEASHAANMWKSAYYMLLNQYEKMRNDANAVRELMHKELVTGKEEIDPEVYAQQVHSTIDLACRELTRLEGTLLDSLSAALDSRMESGKGMAFKNLPSLLSRTSVQDTN
jgi:hypothetical protein